MTDEQHPSWWKSLPGVLTAATGFVAALSGLVAGLNQLGAFRRDQPAQQVVATAPPPRDSSADQRAPAVSSGATSTARTPASDSVRPPSEREGTSPASPRVASPAPAPVRAAAPKPPVSSATAPGTTTPDTVDPGATSPAASAGQLPKGTALELIVPSRSCAPASGARRAPARLAVAVKSGGNVVLPANIAAVLRLQRGDSRTAPRIRADSLIGQGIALAMPASIIRLRGDAADGWCLRAHARLTAILGAAMAVPRR